MSEYIEWVKSYVRELDSLLTTGGISLKEYWAECKHLCEQIDEKCEEINSNRSAFDRIFSDSLKILGDWLG